MAHKNGRSAKDIVIKKYEGNVKYGNHKKGRKTEIKAKPKERFPYMIS